MRFLFCVFPYLLAFWLPVSASAGPADADLPTAFKVVLLKPLVRFEDVRGEVPRVSASEDEYRRVLADTVKQELSAKLTLIDLEKLDAPAVEVCTSLEPLLSRLARGDVNQEALDDFARLSAFDDKYAVLVQYLRIETGPRGSWNPYTGGITSSAASTLLQTALLSAKTGKVVWKNERLIRNKALKPSDANLTKALMALYRYFGASGDKRSKE